MNLSGLIPLQKAHSEAEGVLKRLTHLEEEFDIPAAEAAVEQADKVAADIAAEAKVLSNSLKESKNLVDDIHAKIVDREERLVRTNVVKEIQGLQGTLKSLRKQEDDAEEEVLMLEEQLKQKEAALAEASKSLEDLRAKLESVRSQWQTEKAQLEAHHLELRGKEEALQETLDPALRAEFYSQVERRAGIALAFVVNGTCSECHMSMAAEPLRKIRKGDVLVYCQNCRRILLHDDPEREADALRQKALAEKGKTKSKRPSNRENEVGLLQLLGRTPEAYNEAYWHLHHWLERLDQFGIEWFFQNAEGKLPMIRFRTSLMQRVRRGRVFLVFAFEPPEAMTLFVPHQSAMLEERHAHLLQKHGLAFRKDAWNGEDGYGPVTLKVGSPDFTATLADLKTLVKTAAYEALQPT